MRRKGIFLLLFVGQVAWAASALTPQQSVELQIQVSQMTIEGMQNRLSLLQSDASQELQYKSDNETRELISQTYKDFGVTPTQHLKFRSENEQVISEYLSANPVYALQLDQLDRQFEQLSNSISRLTAEPIFE